MGVTALEQHPGVSSKLLMSGLASQADKLNIEDQGRVGWNHVPKPALP
jgi:hypothetical protein